VSDDFNSAFDRFIEASNIAVREVARALEPVLQAQGKALAQWAARPEVQEAFKQLPQKVRP
jgi:hypothetical protein